MGGEKLWWTWGMAGRGTSANGTLVGSPSTGEGWNSSADQDTVGGSGNDTWTSGSASGSERDLVVMIITAVVLCLLILATVVGEHSSFTFVYYT